MKRQVVFDTTHLIARQHVSTPTGIDRVDHAFAAELSANGGITAGVTCAFGFPRYIAPSRVSAYAASLGSAWAREDTQDDDAAYRLVRNFLTGDSQPAKVERRTKRGSIVPEHWVRNGRLVRRLLENDTRLRPPDGSIILNVTQNPELVPRLGRMLDREQRFKAVFLVHDLIPVDFPECFAAERQGDFARVLETMFRHASGFIVTTDFVRGRLIEEMRRRGIAEVPIWVRHLPVHETFLTPPDQDAELAAARYVVMLGTIEPRKNHWLLLHLWRQMIANHDDPPRLVMVGALGWLNDDVRDLFERTPELKDHVLHVPGLSDHALRTTLAHARALVLPSFVEGFGIPVVEAACLGTPMITGSHSVFDDVSQGLAIRVDPLDGPGWRRAVMRLAGPDSRPRDKFSPLPNFVPQTAASYFSDIRSFLAEI